MDGATVARALARLEEELTGSVLAELRGEIADSGPEIHLMKERVAVAQV